MKRFAASILIIFIFCMPSCSADILKDIGSWISDAATDVWDWTSQAAVDAWDWTSGAAVDAWDWTSQAATGAWEWTSDTASGAWNGVSNFFDPPSTEGSPSIVPEPELPDGVKKMYLGYDVIKTEAGSGYSTQLEIDIDDPHFGLSLGKFYISGFSSVISDNESFIFLKTVGDNLELHFELVQDIDMLGGDTFLTIAEDDGGYDKYFEVPPTYMGRGTLIVRHTDYQNNRGQAQVYKNYLAAKSTDTANTVISLCEEGDYEVALNYKIRKNSYVAGVNITKSSYSDYRIFFRFSVRNGNCMVFPFDAVTRTELQNTSIAPNGFYFDLARSRYLDVNVKLSILTMRANGIVEDIRFNRPAREGDIYDREGIYTITVGNRYTSETTTKLIYVGNDEEMIAYISNLANINQDTVEK